MSSILVVEDDKAIRNALVCALEDEGYDAQSSSDGQRALNHLEHAPVDLILVDASMPVLNGSDMVRTLRLMGNAVPVIMMSAQLAWRLPEGVQFLRKPFDLDRLFEAVTEALTP